MISEKDVNDMHDVTAQKIKMCKLLKGKERDAALKERGIALLQEEIDIIKYGERLRVCEIISGHTQDLKRETNAEYRSRNPSIISEPSPEIKEFVNKAWDDSIKSTKKKTNIRRKKQSNGNGSRKRS